MTVILVILVGLFLRIYNIGNTFVFEGELGKELLYLRQYYLLGKLPLIGLATSHEWLNYGPFYYWIMMPIFSMFNGNPFVLFWTAVVVAVVGLTLNYYIVIKLAGKKIALISTSIQAISPLLVDITRLSKLHVFFFILSPIFMYLCFMLWNGKKKWVFWLGVIYGLMFSFHFSQLPLILVVFAILWFKRKIYTWRDWMKFVIGVIILTITFIWQDVKLFVWIPYRIIYFADKNPGGTLQALTEYFGRNIFYNQSFWLTGLVIFAIVFVHYVFANRKNLTREFLPFYLVSSVGVTVLSNVLHGTPPLHYFLPIFIIVPILYSIYLAKYKWSILVLVLIFLVNTKNYFSFNKPEVYVPLLKQLAIANFIVSDSNHKQFSIGRIGPYDYFPDSYAQNYEYLVLRKGGNLIENSGNKYTIVEENNDAYVQK